LIVLLSGAKKNIGDFLISDRAERILRHVTGQDVVRLPNWEPLDGHLEVLAKASGLVVAGGPGYRPDLYGGVYPLTREPAALAGLGMPVTFFGLGWKGDPGDDFDLATYRFGERTLGLVTALGENGRYSARDQLSYEVLVRNGVPGPVMSGCPVWYDLDSLGVPFEPPTALRTIVFTPPEQRVFHAQSRRLLQELVRAYPESRVIVAFHRGIEADEHTSATDAEALVEYAAFARSLGCDVRDVSYDLGRIAFYRDADAHVGYRLHAHLCFLSYRKPSIVLEEDGRARGAAEALGTPSVRAWRLTRAGKLPRTLRSRTVSRAVKRLGWSVKAARDDVSEDALAALEDQRAAGFPAFRAAAQRIDATWPVMERFTRGTTRDA